MKSWLDRYTKEIIGAVIGFLIASSFLALGFLKTIFMLAIVVIGVTCGHYWTKVREVFIK